MLFGDDGFGPAVAEYLNQHYAIADDVYVMDVGTGVRRILFTLALSESLPDEIVVVDSVDWGHNRGEVLELSLDDLPVNKIDDFSLHQVPTSNMLRELRDRRHVKVAVYACDVGKTLQLIQPGLSSGVEQAVLAAGRRIADRFALRRSDRD